MPPALRDRMEVIELNGYIEDEKVRIAQQHLLPKQVRANGLKPEEVAVEEAALRTIIADYTREAGVRNLERQIGNVLRKVTRRLAEQQDKETRRQGDKENQQSNVSPSPHLPASLSPITWADQICAALPLEQRRRQHLIQRLHRHEGQILEHLARQIL